MGTGSTVVYAGAHRLTGSANSPRWSITRTRAAASAMQPQCAVSIGTRNVCDPPAGTYTRGGYGSSPVSRLWLYSRSRSPPTGNRPGETTRTVSSARSPRRTRAGADSFSRTRNMAGKLTASESAGSASSAPSNSAESNAV